MTQLSMFGGEGQDSLAQARLEALECRRCDLWRTGYRTVFGSGDPAAALMIVGEGPAEADDRTGKPFSGPSGRLLDEWLDELGLTRDTVWLTNVVKHRPVVVERGREKNRPPRASETAACKLWLDLELSSVRPAFILALGGSAGKALLGKDFKITQGRGTVLPGPAGTPTLATFHPAYLLRLESPELETSEEAVRHDLALVRQALAAQQ